MAKLKLTEELQEDICNEIKAGTPMKYAAISHGISESTFYNWYNKGEEAKSGKFRKFYLAIEEAKSTAITLRTRRIYKAGKDNWQADAWWLERVCPEEFGRHEKRDVNLKGDLDVKQTNVPSDKEIEEIINELSTEYDEYFEGKNNQE